jgi:hypothetical protein
VTVHVYRLEVTYPPGSRQPDWRPACWSDPEFLRRLSRRARRHHRRAGFRWPAERMFLSASGARQRAGLLRWYGADVEVFRSLPVEWAEMPPGGAR